VPPAWECSGIKARSLEARLRFAMWSVRRRPDERRQTGKMWMGAAVEVGRPACVAEGVSQDRSTARRPTLHRRAHPHLAGCRLSSGRRRNAPHRKTQPRLQPSGLDPEHSRQAHPRDPPGPVHHPRLTPQSDPDQIPDHIPVKTQSRPAPPSPRQDRRRRLRIDLLHGAHRSSAISAPFSCANPAPQPPAVTAILNRYNYKSTIGTPPHASKSSQPPSHPRYPIPS